MQNKYCDLLEREDAQIFSAFNNDQGWFKQLIFNKKGSIIDASAIDRNNRKCHVEIKQRTGKYGSFKEFIDNFETIYLDYGKMNEFSEIMLHSGATRNEGEAFVSIFDKGDTILVHDICKPQPTLHMPNQRVWNEARRQWDIEHKVGLYWWCATIYKKQEDGHYRKLNDDEVDQLKWNTKLVQHTN